MWNLKSDANELIWKTETDTQIQKTNRNGSCDFVANRNHRHFYIMSPLLQISQDKIVIVTTAVISPVTEFSSVQLISHVQLFGTPWTVACQASLSFTISWSLLKLMSIESVMPSNHLILSAPSPAFNLSQHQGFFFKWVSSSYQVAKILELHHQSFQWIFRTDFLYDWLVWSPCCPRDSQESSLAPQIKSINSSVVSFLYSPTLTSIHDYWKNHSLD